MKTKKKHVDKLKAPSKTAPEPVTKSSQGSRKVGTKPELPSAINEWVETGDCRYMVRLSGERHAAIVWADSKAEAREKFLELFGILSTEKVLECREVDEDHGYTINEHGIVDPSEL